MRRKNFGQVIRFALAMTMIGFLVFDTSMAGCLNRYLNRRNCQPAPTCCVELCCPQPVVCCPPPIHCQPVCPPVDCCGSAPIVYSHSGCVEGTIIGTPVQGSTVGVPTEATDQADDSHHDAEPAPTVADTDSEADADSAFEDMGDDAGAAGADTAMDDDSTEDILPPDSIDGDDAASDDTDEVFGATPEDADTGADAGTDAADSTDDGGFGDGAFDDADGAFGDTEDDGFGPADDAEMDDASATTDDIGGFEDAGDSTGDAADEEEDIFGGDDFGGADDFGAGDDTGAADDGFDDVLDGDDFGGDDADLDAIFDDGAKIDRGRDGFREVIPVAARRSTDLPYRLWTDNTGEYRTVGRLVQITKTHVRMLKDNGKHSTVAKTRLSKADLKYAAEMEAVLGLRDNFDAIALR